MTRGDLVQIDPRHPFYGGVPGVFEFHMGEKDEVGVFSYPRETEDEPKVFFMIRPGDRTLPVRDEERSEIMQFLRAAGMVLSEEGEEEDGPECPEEIPDPEIEEIPDQDHGQVPHVSLGITDVEPADHDAVFSQFFSRRDPFATQVIFV